MKKQDMATGLFSESVKEMISEIDTNPVSTIDDIIRVQEATDKSHKLHAVLESWSEQKTEERKLRKLYALCFVVILAIQIIIMNIVFILVGRAVLIIGDIHFNVFFVSMFGEITALILIVTKYLFPNETESKVINIIKDL